MIAPCRICLAACIATAIVLAAVSLDPGARQAELPLPLAAKLAQADGAVAVPFGSPSAAQRYHVDKRLPLDRTIDTRSAYRQAAAHAARMPLYSSARGRHLSAAEARRSQLRGGSLKGRWKVLGPGNVGGRTRTLVVDRQRPETMYAGGVSGGVWKTTDGGAKWTSVGDGLANVAVNSMAMDPGNARVLYVGTGEGYFREDVRGTGLPLRGGGVFRTTNGGKTWSMLAATDNEDFWFVNDLVFSPSDSRTLYAATRTGVHRTSDAGDTWDRILDPGVTGGCLDLEVRADRPTDVLFASCGTFDQATVYRSNDAAARSVAAKSAGPDAGVSSSGGVRSSAAAFEPVLSERGMGRTSIALAPSDEDVIYALAASNDGGAYEQALHAVYRSDGGGDPGSWVAQVRNTDPDAYNTLLLHNAVVARLDACGFGDSSTFLPMGWYVNTIAVDPLSPDIVWAAGVDWFRSSDGGRTWGPASFWWTGGGEATASHLHADQHRMVFHPAYDGVGNQTLFVVNDGGVWRTDNGRAPVSIAEDALCDPGAGQVAWQPLNNSFEVTQFYQGLPFPDGKAFLGGTQDNGTNLRPPGGGPNGWVEVFGGDGGYVAIDPRDPRLLYVESQNANLQKSDDGGASFTPATNGLPPGNGAFLDPGGNFVFITPFVLDAARPDTLWIGGKLMYRTVNGAASWQVASRKLRGRASAIAVSPSDSHRVAVATELGFVHTTDDALAAGPATAWPRRRPSKAWATWVAYDPIEPDVLYLTYGGFGGPHVFRSSDGGSSWTSIDGIGEGSLPDIPVHVIVVDPDNPARLFLGTDLGVFVSTDTGTSWAQENAGFGNIVTESLTLQHEGAKTMLYAFTHGRGAWRVRVKPTN